MRAHEQAALWQAGARDPAKAQDIGADDCVWCGKALRRKHWVERERVQRDVPKPRCSHPFDFETWEVSRDGESWCCDLCGTYAEMYVSRVVSKRPVYEASGDYGDGLFCGLRCGYAFGVMMATHHDVRDAIAKAKGEE